MSHAAAQEPQASGEIQAASLQSTSAKSLTQTSSHMPAVPYTMRYVLPGNRETLYSNAEAALNKRKENGKIRDAITKFMAQNHGADESVKEKTLREQILHKFPELKIPAANHQAPKKAPILHVRFLRRLMAQCNHAVDKMTAKQNTTKNTYSATETLSRALKKTISRFAKYPILQEDMANILNRVNDSQTSSHPKYAQIQQKMTAYLIDNGIEKFTKASVTNFAIQLNNLFEAQKTIPKRILKIVLDMQMIQRHQKDLQTYFSLKNLFTRKTDFLSKALNRKLNDSITLLDSAIQNDKDKISAIVQKIADSVISAGGIEQLNRGLREQIQDLNTNLEGIGITVPWSLRTNRSDDCLSLANIPERIFKLLSQGTADKHTLRHTGASMNANILPKTLPAITVGRLCRGNSQDNAALLQCLTTSHSNNAIPPATLPNQEDAMADHTSPVDESGTSYQVPSNLLDADPPFLPSNRTLLHDSFSLAKQERFPAAQEAPNANKDESSVDTITVLSSGDILFFLEGFHLQRLSAASSYASSHYSVGSSVSSHVDMLESKDSLEIASPRKSEGASISRESSMPSITDSDASTSTTLKSARDFYEGVSTLSKTSSYYHES